MSLEQLHPAGRRLNLEPPCASIQNPTERSNGCGKRVAQNLIQMRYLTVSNSVNEEGSELRANVSR